MQVDTFWMPKSGHTAEEYEDAFCTSELETDPFRAAVADGATESAFSGGWARMLAAAYVEYGDLTRAAAAARSQFVAPEDPRWYIQQKAAQGAHAALLGLQLNGDAWRAEWVGDCCLVHVRDGVINGSWPHASPAAFDHRPSLVSSRQAPDDVQTTAGRCRPGDVLVLASDALAAWLIGGAASTFLKAEDRPALIRSARADRESSLPPLRNDDLTALIIHPEKP